MVKNPPAMQEIQAQSLCGEDPLGKEMVSTPVFLFGEVHGQRSWWATVLALQSQTRLTD